MSPMDLVWSNEGTRKAAGQTWRESLLVRRGDAPQQRARPRAGGVPQVERKSDPPIAEAGGRAQPAPQGHRLSVGDVDAQLLRPPRGESASTTPAGPPPDGGRR